MIRQRRYLEQLAARGVVPHLLTGGVDARVEQARRILLRAVEA